MKPGVTTEFETTEFAGITAKIINPYPSPFTVLDMTIKPGFGAPAHISSTEDKLFIVIEGQLKYLIGDKTETVGPGARVIIPRGVIHGFTNIGVGDARGCPRARREWRPLEAATSTVAKSETKRVGASCATAYRADLSNTRLDANA
jgi:quercetin dioxygenase-like cupin family protein